MLLIDAGIPGWFEPAFHRVWMAPKRRRALTAGQALVPKTPRERTVIGAAFLKIFCRRAITASAESSLELRAGHRVVLRKTTHTEDVGIAADFLQIRRLERRRAGS